MEQLTKVEKGASSGARSPSRSWAARARRWCARLRWRCCDLDHLMVQGEAPIPGEIALGHEQVGEVVAVGDDGARPPGGRPGGRAVPDQLRRVRRCPRGRTGDCEAVPPQSMYGFGVVGGDWGGALSDLVRVPYRGRDAARGPGRASSR